MVGPLLKFRCWKKRFVEDSTQVSGEYETTQPKRDQLLERQLKRRPGSGVENETSKRDLLIHRNQYNRAEHVT